MIWTNKPRDTVATIDEFIWCAVLIAFLMIFAREDKGIALRQESASLV